MDETREDLPLIPDAVIKYLEKVFPNEYPVKELNPYQLGAGAGEQRVINHLKQVKQWSEEIDVQD